MKEYDYLIVGVGLFGAKKLFPHYHQQESAGCGPVCLRMIAKASYKILKKWHFKL